MTNKQLAKAMEKSKEYAAIRTAVRSLLTIPINSVGSDAILQALNFLMLAEYEISSAVRAGGSNANDKT